jgi:hypothetical protein
MRNWKDKISENISYTEATKSLTASRKGINNTPNEAAIEKMKYVAKNVFEPLRKHFEVPIGISSFYRSEALNKAVGGSKTSEHIEGSAIDIDADIFGLITNKDIFNYIKDNLNFNQLIWEYGDNKEPDWVHVSLKKNGNKKQVLKTYTEKNWKGQYITKYKNYE